MRILYQAAAPQLGQTLNTSQCRLHPRTPTSAHAAHMAPPIPINPPHMTRRPRLTTMARRTPPCQAPQKPPCWHNYHCSFSTRHLSAVKTTETTVPKRLLQRIPGLLKPTNPRSPRSLWRAKRSCQLRRPLGRIIVIDLESGPGTKKHSTLARLQRRTPGAVTRRMRTPSRASRRSKTSSLLLSRGTRAALPRLT